MHDQGRPQGDAEPDRVQQGKDKGHLPHQEQDTIPGHGSATGDAFQLKGRCKRGRIGHELDCSLQVPEQNDGDQQPGDPDRAGVVSAGEKGVYGVIKIKMGVLRVDD